MNPAYARTQAAIILEIFKSMKSVASKAHSSDGQSSADATLMLAAVRAYEAFKGE